MAAVVAAVAPHDTFGSAAIPTIAPDAGGGAWVVVVEVVDVAALVDELEVVDALEVGVDDVLEGGVDVTVTVSSVSILAW
jgi:hypothetical protein